MICFFFFFQAEDGIRDLYVTGVQTCALPISPSQRDGQLPAEEFVRHGVFEGGDGRRGRRRAARTATGGEDGDGRRGRRRAPRTATGGEDGDGRRGRRRAARTATGGEDGDGR